jgi:solute carrier family 25 carnitine/acylcarnitine transporter 20/29
VCVLHAGVQGARGFFRGLLPPLLGSAAYRGILFGAYSATFTACEGTALGQPIPGTAGLRPSVLLGAAAGAAARTAIETPLEVMKVRRHLGETWQTGTNVRSIFTPTQILELYKGTTPTFLRTASCPTSHLLPRCSGRQRTGLSERARRGMLGTFFVLVDYSARFFPEAVRPCPAPITRLCAGQRRRPTLLLPQVNTPLVGPFFKGGICTTAGWFIAWPFETVKSRVQGDTTGKLKGQSTMKILRTILAEDGVRRGLYRGFLPGALRSFVSNGASMVMFQAVQSMRPAPKSGK